MPRNSWRRAAAPTNATPEGPPPEDALPADLRRLLSERRALEARMAGITGGPAAEDEADPRYPVTPLGPRRAADARWAAGRDAARTARPPQHAEEAGRATPTGQRAALPPPLRALAGGEAGEPPLRALSDAPQLRALTDALNRPLRDTARRISNGADLPERTALSERTDLPPQTTLRDLAEPALRPLRELGSDRAADRLDILRGGSGDLDRLRRIAGERARQRREDQRQQDRRGRDAEDRDSVRDADRDWRRMDRQRRWSAV